MHPPVRLMEVIILCCQDVHCIGAVGKVGGCIGLPLSQPDHSSVYPILDRTHRDRLSTGFVIYGPLYKKGLGTQRSLSCDIESTLPGVEMWVVRYCEKAYLHDAVELSALATACFAFALKFFSFLFSLSFFE